MSDNLEDSSHRVASLQHLVDFTFHLRLDLGIGTVQQDFILIVESGNLLPANVFLHCYVSNGENVAENLDAEFAQKGLCDCTHCDSSRRLAGGRALQNVA